MAQMVLQQVLILSAMMMLGFLLGKLGKVDRKGADLLSMLLLDVFFPCNVLAAASGDFGDMPFSQVLKIIAAYLSMFILFTYLAKPIAKLMGLNEDETPVSPEYCELLYTPYPLDERARLHPGRRDKLETKWTPHKAQ